MATPDSTTYKTCSHCGQEYPATLEYFHRNKRYSDGLSHYCKTCKSKSDAAYRAKYRDKLLEGKRLWYQRNKKAIVQKVK